jgi:hypothetical protein
VKRRRPAEFTSLGEIGVRGRWETDLRGPFTSLAVYDAWRRAAGPQLEKMTRPVEWDGQRLVIEVSDPIWLRNLQGMRGRILEEVNRQLRPASGTAGGITRILELVLRSGSHRS